jgi:hypothetical protein
LYRGGDCSQAFYRKTALRPPSGGFPDFFGDGIASLIPRSTIMSFGIYLIGYIILIVGLAIGAHLMHMPPRWIGVGVVILLGLGIVTGVTSTRNRDSSS